VSLKLFLLTSLASLLASPVSAEPSARPLLNGAQRWACFYGGHLSQKAWDGLDLAVVDPDSFRGKGHFERGGSSSGPVRLAYVSAGEAEEQRSYWPSVEGKPFVIGPNPDWPKNHYADLRDPRWRAVLLDAVVPGALSAGYQGVMLDTLDTAHMLESSAPARFQGSIRAAGDFVLELRERFPGILILVNNAFPLLERVGGAVDGVLAEDVYTRCLPKDKLCGRTPGETTLRKEAALTAFRKKTDKPVFVLLYAYVSQRENRWVRRAVLRARRKGFFPYLASPSLERLGEAAGR